MLLKIEKSIFIRLFVVMIICLWPAGICWSAVAVQSEIVSGTIVKQYDDNSIELDNGKIYQPSRKDLEVTLPQGESVTLRYVVDENGKNVFFEYAPGVNSLMAHP